MSIHPLPFGDEGQRATREMMRRCDALAERLGGSAAPAPIAALRAQLATFEALDRQYGGTAAIALEDAAEHVSEALAQLARLDSAAGSLGGDDVRDTVDELVLAVALWAVRHDVAVARPEPVANALARRSNRAGSKAELAAVYGLMQGVIAHVAATLAADLERSNPERAWRVLHANFAITAIRTEDARLMEHAFDALDRALPDERAGFYAEALALALAPGIAPVVREHLEARHRRWTSVGKS